MKSGGSYPEKLTQVLEEKLGGMVLFAAGAVGSMTVSGHVAPRGLERRNWVVEKLFPPAEKLLTQLVADSKNAPESISLNSVLIDVDLVLLGAGGVVKRAILDPVVTDIESGKPLLAASPERRPADIARRVRAAAHGASKKHALLDAGVADLGENASFYPFAFSSEGSYAPDVELFFRDFCGGMKPAIRDRWFTRLAIAAVRGTGRVEREYWAACGSRGPGARALRFPPWADRDFLISLREQQRRRRVLGA